MSLHGKKWLKHGMLLLVVSGSLLSFACSKIKRHPKPYQEFYQMGFFGHGRGLAGELRLNIWKYKRRCDTCHAVEKAVHLSMEQCNSCHQFHPAGWPSTLVAIGHETSLELRDTMHGKLACKKCHTSPTTREAYRRQIECISCHDHNKDKTESHHDLMDEFDMEANYRNDRCVSCHTRTKKEYAIYYDPITHEIRD